ncbi:MAG TPA: L-threonylcarbamoyladenylate synthase [Tepidiformaceae bacterium]|nr:L-threonylcarbamoyladenylate synthase [Tepidiformaceae bacterium]
MSEPSLIERAVELLREGELVILPTDTVYGVACDARNDDAVEAIYRAKQRDPSSPLQLLFGRDAALVSRYAKVTPAAHDLIETLGPGAWTVIVPAADGFTSRALAGGRTVGIRAVPVDIVLDIVDALGAPLAASSANVAEAPSPTTCDEAKRQLGAFCAMAIDGGPTSHGLDSTVIDLSLAEPTIVREGAIDRATVARILGISQIPVLRSVRQ